MKYCASRPWTQHCGALAVLLTLCGLGGSDRNICCGQQNSTNKLVDKEDVDVTRTIADLLKALESPDFRTRIAARQQLKTWPMFAISAIERDLLTARVDVATQEIELLDYFANLPDLETSTRAFDALQIVAERKVTNLSSLASKCIEAIEEAKEKQAIELLSFADVRIGQLAVSLNGSTNGEGFAVEIESSSFKGDRQVFQWLQYLRSIDIVSVDGPFQIDRPMMAAIAKMPRLSKIRFRNVQFDPGCLTELRKVDSLKHLELMYVNLGDESIPTLCELPIDESLRLFGTQITTEGQRLIRSRLDGLDIYIGAGGFLGITSGDVGEVRVGQLVQDGAAEKAGIMPEDVILQIDDEPIKNFPALRSLLANFPVGREINVTIRRGSTLQVLKVTLGEQP
jgi:PDZ domain